MDLIKEEEVMMPIEARVPILGLALAGAVLSVALVCPAIGQCEPSEIQRLVSDDIAEYDRFGYAVAVRGDTVFVGAHGDEPAGACYVFRRDEDGGWIEVQKLTASDAQMGDKFGIAVDVAGDTAIVGTQGFGQQAGAAYVFRDDGQGVWVEVQKIVAADGQAGDGFGGSLAMSGDTAIIGAKWDDDLGENAGSAYIFREDETGTWTQIDKVIGSHVKPFIQFGEAVDISGDTAVVGAPVEGNGPGSAYIFRDDGTGDWVEVDFLLDSDGGPQHFFGHAVAIVGGTAVIGAPEDVANGTGAGAAYIFRDDGTGNWVEIAKITPLEGAEGDLFGMGPTGVAIIDESTVIGGARGADGSESNSGAAFVFHDDGDGWTEIAKLFASDGTAGSSFGRVVAVDGGTAIIGAYNDGANGTWSGSAYLFDLNCACPADVNGDGTLNILDFVAFQLLWQDADPGADCDANAEFNVLDFVCFQGLFLAGCA